MPKAIVWPTNLVPTNLPHAHRVPSREPGPGRLGHGQIPLPSYGSTFTSTLTRGYWFQAPVGFTIQGLSVPNEATQAFQVVEVINLGAAPPAYPGTVVGTQLFYDNSTAGGSIIPCSIPVAPGDYIGILGACTSSVGTRPPTRLGTRPQPVRS